MVHLSILTLVAAGAVLAAPVEEPAHQLEARQSTSNAYINWPTYAQLPLNTQYPTKAAWGVWGTNDSLGALNHITSQTILAAKNEIVLGRTFNLNLELGDPSPPTNPNRRPLIHLYQPGDGYSDDVITMNTQISTQLDGLRHFPYSTNGNVSTYQWYNNLIRNYQEVIGNAPTAVLGIQEAANKGIVGRGVLLDFAAWAATQGLNYSAFSNYSITVSQLDQVAAWQGLPSNWSRPGDILFIRTGWIQQYNRLDLQARWQVPVSKTGASVGLLASDATLEWIWNKKLAMVGADNPAFESTPFDKTISGVSRSLHQVFIGGWGQLILEFINMENIAPALRSLNRSTFFTTITPMNILSGIASPPNAVAVI